VKVRESSLVKVEPVFHRHGTFKPKQSPEEARSLPSKPAGVEIKCGTISINIGSEKIGRGQMMRVRGKWE